MRHSRQTMIGLQPETNIPIELDGRRSAVRLKKTHRFEVAPPRWVPINAPKPMNQATAQCIAFGVVCMLTALAVWVMT